MIAEDDRLSVGGLDDIEGNVTLRDLWSEARLPRSPSLKLRDTVYRRPREVEPSAREPRGGGQSGRRQEKGPLHLPQPNDGANGDDAIGYENG